MAPMEFHFRIFIVAFFIRLNHTTAFVQSQYGQLTCDKQWEGKRRGKEALH